MHVHSDDYRDTCCKIIIIIATILAIAGLLDCQIAGLPKISEQIILELLFWKKFWKKTTWRIILKKPLF